MARSGVEAKGGEAAGEFARRIEAVQPALWAALLGAFIVLSVGFAQPQVIHDAAHDARHAFAFPCH
ncbi:MAG: CbtB-domain containing protein [bacterium]